MHSVSGWKTSIRNVLCKYFIQICDLLCMFFIVFFKINLFDFDVQVIILKLCVCIPKNLCILLFQNRFSSIIFIDLGFTIWPIMYFEYIFIPSLFTLKSPQMDF
jgi:hypothetical protein